MSFGKNLKDIRVDKQFSQEDLAKKIKVHSNHISRYERDMASPSIDVVLRIAIALDVSIDYLVYGKEHSLGAGINDNELAGLFRKVQLLPAKQKDTVKEFLSAFVLKADLKEKLG